MRLRILASFCGFWLAVSPAFAGEAVGYSQVRAALSAKSIRLVDVREASEFSGGHVPGASNLPLSGFRVDALPPASDIPVVLMCQSGRRAAQALELVKAAGRTDVILYPGSMNEWTREGGAVATGP